MCICALKTVKMIKMIRVLLLVIGFSVNGVLSTGNQTLLAAGNETLLAAGNETLLAAGNQTFFGAGNQTSSVAGNMTSLLPSASYSPSIAGKKTLSDADAENENLPAENETPIIGIVAQELSSHMQKLYPAYTSYIAASYVKAVESSGARVVPIPIKREHSYYRYLLNSINGVVLPGGDPNSGLGNPYYDAVTKIYKTAVEMNESKKRFPILGVCLGFEYLITVANNHKNFLVNCSIHDENLPLKFTRTYTETSLYANLGEQVYALLNSSDLTVNNHIWCALEKDFMNSSLKDDWIITSLSTGSTGLEFIASVEHKSLPFYGIQFHPEKVAFEWNPLRKYPHSKEALVANRYFYDTFVNASRMNFNKFYLPSYEKRSLIYNYPAKIDENHSFEQIYLF